jgi:uncharacterized protein YgiM (DUF1202 family)
MKRWIFGVLAIVLLLVFGSAALGQATFGTGWTAQYWNNRELQGNPVHIEALPGGINFNWGTGSPHPTVNVDDFSARFTSTQLFEAGTYEFVVTSDDGVRVFIDGVLVLDRWFPRVLTTDRFQRTLTAGAHTIIVEYFEAVDQAAIQFQWFRLDAVPFATPTPFGTPFVPGPAPTATRIPPTPLPEIPPGALTGTVVRAQVLLVRSAPFFAAPVVGRVLRGQTYQVIGRDPDARWFLLQLSGFQGWVWGFYLFVNGNEFNAPVVSAFITQGDPAAATGVVIQTQSGLRLRAAPDVTSEQIGRIPWGDVLPVIGRTAGGDWYQVVFRGTVGWVAAAYTRVIEGDLNSVPVQ